MSKEDLCGMLDGLKLSRMKCYAMSDCTWEQLREFFFLVYKSTEEFELWNSIDSACKSPHKTSSAPEESQETEQIVEIVLPLQPESPVPE